LSKAASTDSTGSCLFIWHHALLSRRADTPSQKEANKSGLVERSTVGNSLRQRNKLKLIFAMSRRSAAPRRGVIFPFRVGASGSHHLPWALTRNRFVGLRSWSSSPKR